MYPEVESDPEVQCQYVKLINNYMGDHTVSDPRP